MQAGCRRPLIKRFIVLWLNFFKQHIAIVADLVTEKG